MYLDAADRAPETISTEGYGCTAAKRSAVFEPWKDWLPSRISHHGTICCEIAREWVTAADYSYLKGGETHTGPRWLRIQFKWGPSGYPVFWCEAARRATLDCGALAALAHEVFLARGVRSMRAQFVQRFSATAGSQWARNWTEAGVSAGWVNGDLIYHEGCAIEVGRRELKIWDASTSWWLDPLTTSGYGSLAAIRLTGYGRDESFGWGPHKVPADEWHAL